jgi:hypothetical protein
MVNRLVGAARLRHDRRRHRVGLVAVASDGLSRRRGQRRRAGGTRRRGRAEERSRGKRKDRNRGPQACATAAGRSRCVEAPTDPTRTQPPASMSPVRESSHHRKERANAANLPFPPSRMTQARTPRHARGDRGRHPVSSKRREPFRHQHNSHLGRRHDGAISAQNASQVREARVNVRQRR